MKKFNKISILLFLILGITFTSCETTDLDILDDPNNITLDKADLNRYLNAIQLDFSSFIQQIGDNGSELTRINYMFGRTYVNNYQPVTSNTIWAIAYQRMFSDMKEAVAIAESDEEEIANKHIGVIKILKAYTLLTLVDFYGDIPLSEATQPDEFPFPHLDDDASVYAAALAMLDEGISALNSDGLELDFDLYYDNDFSKWIRLANTLKMTAYVNTRLVDGAAMSKFNAIVNSGNFISSSDHDFVFQYGNSESSPNTRHPDYNGDYQATGACGGCYRSNWLMDEMYKDNDPRIRYYFFRQIDCTPGSVDSDGNECATNQESLICSIQARPQHYPPSMVFCNPEAGYWGRDHGNEEGIPPDNLTRTVSGVYPAAGKFDDNDFSGITLGLGGQGAGITPIMLASWVDLMRAEMALVAGNSSSANTFLQASLQKSIAKVMSFGSLDPDGDLAGFAPTSAQVNDYIAGIGSAFTGADTNGKWDILAVQHFVAHYGNGIDSYNLYRRTGFPTSLQFNVEPSSGGFVRSFLYSSNEADVNSNIPQKPGVGVQVFWDTNPPSPGFPFAN